jgi:hypothetical protein
MARGRAMINKDFIEGREVIDLPLVVVVEKADKIAVDQG